MLNDKGLDIETMNIMQVAEQFQKALSTSDKCFLSKYKG